jgi:hypothetical protein
LNSANPTFSEIAIAIGLRFFVDDMIDPKRNRKTACHDGIRFVEIAEYNP